MAKSVVLCAYNVANFPEGDGHFWVYLQYALGLQELGCDVYWLERFRRSADRARDEAALAAFFARMSSFCMGGRIIVLAGADGEAPGRTETLGMSAAQADQVFDRADLLLNFHYAIHPELLGRFHRTALVDIDPGLFQIWTSRNQLAVPCHDHYFTTGETVGRPWACFPDCGLPWVHIRPAVSLEQWPRAEGPGGDAMTTVSAWSSADWVIDGPVRYENSKRLGFLPYRELPRLTRRPLELALFLLTDTDEADRRMLASFGWRIRDSHEVAGTPLAYRDYIRGSRGEFSCAKPSCVRLQNAWVSDRTLCYLASGRPVVVQHTGPSEYLPSGEGMFRFRSPEEAAAALEAIDTDYERHRRAARALAEAHFDARKVAKRILEVAAT